MATNVAGIRSTYLHDGTCALITSTQSEVRFWIWRKQGEGAHGFADRVSVAQHELVRREAGLRRPPSVAGARYRLPHFLE